jgi:hypothetical protein
MKIEQFMGVAGTTIDAPEDPEAALAFTMEKRLGDGLPVVPPTPERVERMLAYWDAPWDTPMGLFPPRNAVITPLHVAANAVMAGCKPEYFPLVMLAIEAICEPPFNLKGVQATTHPCTPVIIFNGPAAREAGVNSGNNAFGPGWQANATIGRAVRLAMNNIGGAIPGVVDMATMGTPGKYTFAVAENEADSPWEPLNVEKGLDKDVTTVTVLGCEGPMNINDHFSKDGLGILTTVAGSVSNVGANNIHYKSEVVIALCPEHAQLAASAGYSKKDAKRFIFDNGKIALGRFSKDTAEERFRKWDPARYGNAPDTTLVPIVQDPDDIILIVLGGPGKHSMYLPSFGATRAVTRPLKRADGRFARSVDEFRT